MIMQNEKISGFTLIEIMVVLVIIGILMALVVPNVIGRPDEARITVAKADLHSIAAALDSHTRALSTLSLHGQRLSRQFEKTLALLKSLQSARQQPQAQPPAKSVQTNRVPPNGFVFPKAAQRAPIRTPTVREGSTPTTPPRQTTKGGSADVN